MEAFGDLTETLFVFPQNFHTRKFVEVLVFYAVTAVFSEIISSWMLSLNKKWSFSLKISSVNVTKFGHIYWINF